MNDRFWSKVDKTDGCWLWTGSKTRDGYGTFRLGQFTRRVHRLAYQHFVGPIPDGLTIDHLCRVRHCLNPEHLEPVTLRENILRGTSPVAEHARQTHCVHGHLFAGDNLRISPRGSRECRACDRARSPRNRNLTGMRPK